MANTYKVKMDGYAISVRAETEDEAKQSAFERLRQRGHNISPKFNYAKYAKVERIS